MFEKIIGNEKNKTILKKALELNKTSHSYLFWGTEGIGKKKIALEFAKKLLCLTPNEENCRCKACIEFDSNNNPDFMMIEPQDGKVKIDQIREMQRKVAEKPIVSDNKVYIIDDSDTMTSEAQNSLLKTLEEPPEHVKFILATTEPQKLPATILSRCQRFDFKRIPDEDIIKRLELVCKESNVNATTQALNIIAALSEGAMRDALSILERCIQDGENNIDENKIKELVGIPKLQYIHCITQAIVEYNIDEAMETITKVLNEGKDLNNLLWEIIKYVKDILMVKTNQKLTIYNDEDFTRLQELSEKVTKERAIRLISELSELENNMKQSTQRQIVFEAGIIKLCDKEISNAPVGGDSGGNGDIYARLDKIENYLRSSGGTTRARAPQTNRTTNQTQNQSKSTTDAIAGIGKNSKPAQYWKDIVNNLKQNGKIVLYTNLINTNAVEVNDMTIGIQFPGGITPFGKAVLEKPENKQELIKQVSVACGKEMNIKFIDTKPQVQEASEEQEISNFANGFDIPFDVVE